MQGYNPYDDPTEELDVLTGQPLMPNTPRDPSDPREKLRSYLAQKMESEKKMMEPGYRDAMRAPQNALMDNSRALSLQKLFSNASAQAGTLGGKSASTAGMSSYMDDLQGLNQQAMQGMTAERSQMQGLDDRREKMLMYLADKYDSDASAKSKAEAAARSEDRAERRTRAAEMGVGMRQQEKADKKEMEMSELNVPGYERTGEVVQGKTEAKDTRDAVGIANTLLKGMDLLEMQLFDPKEGTGSFEYGGTKGATAASTANDLRLQAKELYNLGVLNGPDLTLMLKQIPDPESLGSMFTRDATAQAQLKASKQAMQRKLEESMKARGYRPKGGAPSAGTQKQVQQKFFSPSRNKTKIIYSDGSEEVIDGRG